MAWNTHFVIINAAGDAEIIKEFDRPRYKQATNQEMELEACIVGLEDALDDKELVPPWLAPVRREVRRPAFPRCRCLRESRAR